LAAIIEADDVDALNKFVADRWVAKPALNTGSPLQLQKLLYETLAIPVRLRNKATDAMRAKGVREGNARTDEDAMMMAIKQGDVTGSDAEILKALVEAKSIRTRQGLYWEAYPKFLHHQTGRIHPSLRQSSTNTRRYTGAEPNLQQMDSNPDGVRSVILPHHRNAIIASLDESAQEVRQMADYCKDASLLTCYVGTPDQLRDVHSIVASRIAGCEYAEFRRRLKKGSDEEMKIANDQRQKAKVTLFATLYGAAAPKIAEGLGISEDEAQEYIDAIYEQFPGAKQWKDDTEVLATDQGWVPIHGGSKRHLQSLVTSTDRYTASKALRQAGNARIQAAGGNQLKRIMGRIWDSDLLDKYDYRWYFSVHDETLHSIGRKDAAVVLEKLHSFMCEQFLDVVPSASSIGVGRNFGQLNELGEVFDLDTVQKAVDGLFN
jgi:DNA polymerase-1